MKRYLLLCVALLFSASVILAKPPIRKSRIIKEMKQEIKRTPKYKYSHLPNYFKIKFTGSERYKTKEKGIRTYPYYLADLHVFCKGKYGQVVREQVTVYYIKTGGMWVSDGIFWSKRSSKLISGPKKKAKRPDDKSLRALFEKTLKNGKDLKIEYLKLNMDKNPKFAVKGENFDKAAYIYNLGDMEIKVNDGKPVRYKGVTLDVVFNTKIDEWQMKINANGQEEVK